MPHSLYDRRKDPTYEGFYESVFEKPDMWPRGLEFSAASGLGKDVHGILQRYQSQDMEWFHIMVKHDAFPIFCREMETIRDEFVLLPFWCLCDGLEERLLLEQNGRKNVVQWDIHAQWGPDKWRRLKWKVPIKVTGWKFIHCQVPFNGQEERYLTLHGDKKIYFTPGYSLQILKDEMYVLSSKQQNVMKQLKEIKEKVQMERDNYWNTIVAELKMERDVFKNEFKLKENEWKSERDVLKSERNEFKTERNVLKAERDVLKSERNEFKTERDTFKAERDTFKAERNEFKTERDNVLLENCGLRMVINVTRMLSDWLQK
ncbi:uncharacterized protein TNCV_3889931 [Trichonephila clavipes]|nr:uncharacterized protein TNCV_3889931 [Trichonephila clavipes]